ncbi:octopine dehydrogenase-like [Mercenaria mercenaria]|uniref:octopine dehydrogenase-like n=1 Tax=Mercenaria mercenaria TaxID=6596 RepID=UPI00234F5AA0|nr:octopine dehydrogenase-like [Mercenaria mercenaria]
MAKPLKICVCGGGKSAHVMAIMAASKPDVEVNVLTLYKDEADKWSKAISKDEMVLILKDEDGKTSEVKAKPSVVSKDPKSIVPESDLLIFTVAANTHEEYLKAISGHLHKKIVVVGLPGLPGFEYLCKSSFGELSEQITVMSFEISPWVCEIIEYGKKVEVTRTAKSLNGSILRGKAIPRKPALMSLQMTLGFDPALKQVKHFAELLFTSYTFFNPVIMYGKWKDWDGKALDCEPLMYEDITEETAKLLESCSKEYQDVAHAISAKKPEVDLTEIPDIFNWVVEFYKKEIEDGTSLLKAIQTNKVYKGVKHIMKKNKRTFTPDFECRYLAEDIPMGMVVVRGIAETLELPTPTCDTVIQWGQEKLKKKYLVDGKVAGSDVKETRAPQRFGFTTLEEILSGQKTDS